jgi:hypothetical protein
MGGGFAFWGSEAQELESALLNRDYGYPCITTMRKEKGHVELGF